MTTLMVAGAVGSKVVRFLSGILGCGATNVMVWTF
jgi:hypothetical protein